MLVKETQGAAHDVAIDDWWDDNFAAAAAQEAASTWQESTLHVPSSPPVMPEALHQARPGHTGQENQLSLPVADDVLQGDSLQEEAMAETGDDVFVEAPCQGSSQLETAPRQPPLVRTSTGVPGMLDVLVCTLCGHGLAGTTWNSISPHWRARSHKGTTITVAERASARALFMQSVGSVLADWSEWIPPHVPVAPVEHVLILQAYRCGVIGCANRFVPAGEAKGKRKDNSAWREHHRNKHGVSEFGGRGRPTAATALVARAQHSNQGGAGCNDDDDADDDAIAEGAWGSLRPVQRLFTQGPYHEVIVPQGTGPPPSRQQDDNDEAAAVILGREFARLQREKAEDEQAIRAVIAGPRSLQADPWHRVSGFSRRLEGYEWNAARMVTDPPGEASTHAQRWVHRLAVSTITKSYHATMRTTGPWMLELVNRRVEREPAKKPLNGYQKDGALGDHIRPLVRCIDYLAATQLDPKAGAAAPSYHMGAEAERAWTRLLDVVDSAVDSMAALTTHGGRTGMPLEPPEVLVLELVVALLRQQGTTDECVELPLIVALTVQGIRPGKTPSFYRAGEYSRMLASFSKMARCVVCAYLQHGEMEKQTAADHVDAMLVRGPNTTMNWLIRMLNVALEIDKATPNHTKVTWMPEQERVLLDQYNVTRTNLVGIVQGARLLAEEYLCRLLHVASTHALPPVPLDRMVDRPSDHTPGWSCWTDSANADVLEVGNQWLLRHIQATQPGHYVDEASQRLRDIAVYEYEQWLRDFRNACIPLFTWAIGPPIRGETIANYRWRNTPQNSRNLFVYQGSMVLAGGWHKNSGRGGEAAVHVLPHEVADLWGWYLWLVVPFAETLQQLRGHTSLCLDADSALLFPGQNGRYLSTSDISHCLCEASRREVHPGFGLQVGRQIVSAFVRGFVPSDVLAGGGSFFVDGRQESQSGMMAQRHGQRRLADRHRHDADTLDYASNNNDSDTDDEVSIQVVGDARAARRVPTGGDPFERLRDLFRGRSMIARQTGHSTAMDRLRYANDADALPGTDDLAYALWSCVSRHWHLVLRFPSALALEQAGEVGSTTRASVISGEKRRRQTPSTNPRALAQSPMAKSRVNIKGEDNDDEDDNDDDDEGNIRHHIHHHSTKRLRHDPTTEEDAQANRCPPSRVMLRGLLRQFVGDRTADFREGQWEPLECITGFSGSSVVVVAPTGKGKTALMMLPAMLPLAGTTVVVVPLSALRSGLVDRCNAARIRCGVWRGDTDCHDHVNGANIVLVMPEHLCMPRFCSWMQILCMKKQLDRIIIDEAHMPQVTNKSWRPALQDFGQLATYGAPLVLLTATLPRIHQDSLIASVFLHHSVVEVFRSSTVRRNMAYMVAWAEDEFPQQQNEDSDECSIEHMAALVLGHRKRMMTVRHQTKTRTMVFCCTVAAAAGLAAALPGAWIYTAHTLNKEANLAAFEAAPDGILCTTSALAYGFDSVQEVDDVVHSGWPDSLENYVQETGRAGRMGGYATALLLVGRGVYRRKAEPGQDGADAARRRQHVDDYVQRHPAQGLVLACRRKAIDAYLDGDETRERCRAEQGELLCDVCLARETHARLDRDTVSARQWDESPDESHTSLPPPYEERDDDTSLPGPVTPHRDAWRTPMRQSVAPLSEARSALYSSSSAISQSYNPSDEAVASRRGSVHLGSPQVPRMRIPPQPDRDWGDRTAAMTKWYADQAQMDAAAWSDGKMRCRLMGVYWKTHCAAHMLASMDIAGCAHTQSDCHGLVADQKRRLRERARQWNAIFSMPAYSGCFTCKMPQTVCQPGRCSGDWQHIVMDAWVFCTELWPMTTEIHHRRLAELRIDPQSDNDVIAYFRQKEKIPGVKGRRESLEVTRLVQWLVQLTEQGFTRLGERSLGVFR